MSGKTFRQKRREVARATAGGRVTVGIEGPTGTKVQRLRQAVCWVGVDWAMVRLLGICKHTQNEAGEEETVYLREPDEWAGSQGWAGRGGVLQFGLWQRLEGCSTICACFFSAIFALGMAVRELNGVLYVMCECPQICMCVCVCVLVRV